MGVILRQRKLTQNLSSKLSCSSYFSDPVRFFNAIFCIGVGLVVMPYTSVTTVLPKHRPYFSVLSSRLVDASG